MAAHDAELLARAILAAPGEGMGEAVKDWLAELCWMRSLVITAYTGDSATTVYHNLSEADVAQSILPYERGVFRLDPFFHACVMQRREGVFRLRELAPDQFRRTAYFQDFYRHLGQIDEVGVVLPDQGIVLSIDPGGPGFPRGARQRLQEVMPVLRALMQLHRQQPTTRSQTAISSANFLSEELSEREREVVLLLLRGHSTASIAANLGISEGTVKVHRKHVYQKLRISTQAQLFNLYIAKLG